MFSKQRVSQREELSARLTCTTGARHMHRPVSNVTALISFPPQSRDNRVSVGRTHTWRRFPSITQMNRTRCVYFMPNVASQRSA